MTHSLAAIKKLITNKQYEEALAGCDAILQSSTDPNFDVLKARALVIARQGRHERALKDWQILLELREARANDFYLAADAALHAGQYELAVTWLRKTITLGEEQNNRWFESAAYFLLAYTQSELDCHSEAIRYLDCAVAIEPDVSMPLPNMCSSCTHQQLRERIMRRAESASHKLHKKGPGTI